MSVWDWFVPGAAPARPVAQNNWRSGTPEPGHPDEESYWDFMDRLSVGLTGQPSARKRMTEGDGSAMMDVGVQDLGGALAGMFKAYQGGPNIFRPKEGNPLGGLDWGKINSGEGTQHETVGHYVSESPQAANWYRETYANRNNPEDPKRPPGGSMYEFNVLPEKEDFIPWDKRAHTFPTHVLEGLKRGGAMDPSVYDSIHDYQSYMGDIWNTIDEQGAKRGLHPDDLQGLMDYTMESVGTLRQDMGPADLNRLLRELDEAGYRGVTSAARSHLDMSRSIPDAGMFDGRDYLKELNDKLNPGAWGQWKGNTSKKLYEEGGLPGVAYRGAINPDTSQRNRNYVLYDDSLADVTKKVSPRELEDMGFQPPDPEMLWRPGGKRFQGTPSDPWLPDEAEWAEIDKHLAEIMENAQKKNLEAKVEDTWEPDDATNFLDEPDFGKTINFGNKDFVVKGNVAIGPDNIKFYNDDDPGYVDGQLGDGAFETFFGDPNKVKPKDGFTQIPWDFDTQAPIKSQTDEQMVVAGFAPEIPLAPTPTIHPKLAQIPPHLYPQAKKNLLEDADYWAKQYNETKHLDPKLAAGYMKKVSEVDELLANLQGLMGDKYND